MTPEEKQRQAEYLARSKAVETRMNTANTAAAAAAKKKKGNQSYNVQSLSNPTDFGAGQAGPGIPYSIKTRKVYEGAPWTQKQPNGPTPSPKLNASELARRGSAAGLWSTPGEKVDWRLAAIRRRLNNG